MTVATLLIALWAPLVASLYEGERTVSATENRFLAELPRVEAGAWRDYPRRLEAYYDDHVGFRTALIRGYARLKIGLFASSPTDKLVVGKQGWLYFGDPAAIAQYRGVAPLSPQQLDDWRATLLERRDWLADRGIAFLFVLVPDKPLVYPEYMPERLPRAGETHPIGQLARYLQETTDLHVLDLRPALERAKAEARIYHRTDSHWNDLGAYVGYRSILESLRPIVPALRDAQPLRVSRGSHVTSGMGLASIVGLARAYREERIDATPIEPRARVKPEHRETYDERVRRMVPIALGTDDPAQPRAVMFRDSFANALVPYLSENFSRILYVWDRDVDPRVVRIEQPDVVIQQVVGRFLPRRPKGIRELE